MFEMDYAKTVLYTGIPICLKSTSAVRKVLQTFSYDLCDTIHYSSIDI